VSSYKLSKKVGDEAKIHPYSRAVKMKTSKEMPIHIPVMLKEVISFLNLREGTTVVDGTLGEGGHSLEILKAIGKRGFLLGIDRDSSLLSKARARFLSNGIESRRFRLIHNSYSKICSIIKKEGLSGADAILLDLGISSAQLESPRGFSYKEDSPLDMRYGVSEERETAAEVVNGLELEELSKVIKVYGEERWAKKIARELVRLRCENPIRTTRELAQVAEKTIPKRFWKRGRHPAMKTFQAIRIYVNSELEEVETGVGQCLKALKEKGRLAVISYHSGEDRIVKNILRDAAKICKCPPSQPVCSCGRKRNFKLITRNIVRPNEEEIKSNRRSRSAKLRVIEKL